MRETKFFIIELHFFPVIVREKPINFDEKNISIVMKLNANHISNY
jgi:hypothetical protein